MEEPPQEQLEHQATHQEMLVTQVAQQEVIEELMEQVV